MPLTTKPLPSVLTLPLRSKPRLPLKRWLLPKLTPLLPPREL